MSSDTAAAAAVLVYNPNADGSELSHFGDGQRAKRWTKSVRSFPTAVGESLIRLGGLFRALSIDDVAARYGVTADGVEAYLPELTTAEYKPHDAAEDVEPITVVVLDKETARTLREAFPRATAAAPPAPGATTDDASLDLTR